MTDNKKKYTILIVEDEPINISILNELLKNDYIIRVATNGEKAERMVASGDIPDLILLDIMLSGKNGYEVCASIKSLPRTKDLPVIFLSGKTGAEEIVKGFKAGAVDYVTKPFNSDELITRVETQLNLLESKRKLENMNLTLIERNHEIEKGMETARLLQGKLLPAEKLEASWIDSHFFFIPIDKVGGDFYDYKVNGNQVELFMADVSGHGLPGALFSTIAKVAKESAGYRESPSIILNALNDVICRYTVDGYFITAFSCILDKTTMTMKYGNAGHCPLIIYRKKDDSLLELKTKGIPLGILENTVYTECIVEVQQGDRLIIYTDGITECSKETAEGNVLWGDEQFFNFIRKNTKISPENFCIKLIDELSEYCNGRPFDDDITFGVVDIL